MLNERKLLLHKNRMILDDDVDDQVEKFMSVFPFSKENVEIGGVGLGSIPKYVRPSRSGL